MASQQLTMFVTDYEKLAEQRDFAAYRAVGAMTAAIVFCREQRTHDALAVLSRFSDTCGLLSARFTRRPELPPVSTWLSVRPRADHPPIACDQFLGPVA